MYSLPLAVQKMKAALMLRKDHEERMISGDVKIYAREGIRIPQPQYYPVPTAGAPVLQKKKVRKKEVLEGIDVEPLDAPGVSPVKEIDRERLMDVNISYPLVPEAPTEGQPVFASVNIKWLNGELQYLVSEPLLSVQDTEHMEFIKRSLEDRLDIDFNKLGPIQASQILRDEIRKAFEKLPGTSPEKRDQLSYYMERDFMGLGNIDVLMRDSNIEDISCDGVGIPVFIFHRDPKFGSIKTNIKFDTAEELNAFVNILAQKCKKTISIAEPLLDGSLPDGSRVQATLGTDIARKGSNFTIRKFTKKPLTPTHMMAYQSMDSTQLAYLWLAVEHGQSMLVSGGTATGKTSMLNALSLFIRPGFKVVSIEDTPELRLPLPHWIPHVARSPLAIKGTIGEVTLFDLLKTSLRQRPDYIIVGEVRGREAFVLFQQIASIPGKEQVFVLNDHNLKRIPITDVDPVRTVGVPTFNPETRTIEIGELKENVTHLPVKELYRITTQTGREVVTTGNHSVFNLSGEAEIVSELKKGDNILVPGKLPCGYNDIDSFNLMNLPGIRVYSPSLIKKASRVLNFEKASKIAGFTTISNYYGVNNCALPAENFLRLMEAAHIDFNLSDITVRFERNSTTMPAQLKITPELLRLVGYHISEGSLNKAYRNNTIALYNDNQEILNDMRECIKKVAGKKTKERTTHGFGSSKELAYSHKVLYEFLKEQTGTRGENKKIPDFVFGLSKKKIGHFLSGLYAGDSHMRDEYFGYYTISRQLANDVALLLLTLGIVATIRKRKRKGRKHTDYEIIFYKRKDKDVFLQYVHPKGKKVTLTKKARAEQAGDVYCDKIRSIKKIKLKKPIPVYDLSVPGTQNFIGGFGGILLHNTGHPSLATIHAATIPQLIDRLITPPISLPPNLLENIDIIIFLSLTRRKGSYVRRANKILEVNGIADGRPETSTIFEWKPVTDEFDVQEKSIVLRKISRRLGLSEETIQAELYRRKKVLDWMLDNEIFDYREVAQVISTYYADPDRVMATVLTKR